MTAIAALATATIVRPDGGSVPPTLERAVRSACAGAWRAVEIVLAGDDLRGRLARAGDPHVRAGTEAVVGMFGRELAARPDALAQLRAARAAGVLDGSLDMAALAASCGRFGDAPVVAAGRRRVRALAIEALRRALVEHRELVAVIGDSAVASLLVDAARALYRNAVRTDRDLARWAVPPTGTTSREQALTIFAELVASPASLDALDKLIGERDEAERVASPPPPSPTANPQLDEPPKPAPAAFTTNVADVPSSAAEPRVEAAVAPPRAAELRAEVAVAPPPAGELRAEVAVAPPLAGELRAEIAVAPRPADLTPAVPAPAPVLPLPPALIEPVTSEPPSRSVIPEAPNVDRSLPTGVEEVREAPASPPVGPRWIVPGVAVVVVILAAIAFYVAR
jgi:hypothetical protein